MDHHFHLTIGLNCATIKLVRDLCAAGVDTSGLTDALDKFEAKTAEESAAVAANTPPPTA